MKARQTLTLLKAQPQLEVRRLDGESDDHYEKRCASIRALGVRWLGHPAYVFHPRHSVYANVYRPARKPFLDAIKVRQAGPHQQRGPPRRRASARVVVPPHQLITTTTYRGTT